MIPASLGGDYAPANLVLLCGRCHREAPNIDNPKFMWVWLRAHSTTLYDTFWTLRGLEEFEKMFGRKLFSNIDQDGVFQEELNKVLKKSIKSATIHFGEGRLNPSTIACVLYEAEEKILSTYDKNT
jgi:hypothetical protein